MKLKIRTTNGPTIGCSSKTLVATGANVRIVAKNIEYAFKESCEGLSIEIIQDDYSKEYIQDAFLVIGATDDNTLNTEIFEDCQQMKVLCNVVDVPHLCNFYVPAVVKRRDLHLTISTNDKCPAYAGHLRRKFQELITEDHGKFLDARQPVINKVPPQKCKDLLAKLSDDDSYRYFLDSGINTWKLRAQKLIADHET